MFLSAIADNPEKKGIEKDKTEMPAKAAIFIVFFNSMGKFKVAVLEIMIIELYYLIITLKILSERRGIPARGWSALCGEPVLYAPFLYERVRRIELPLRPWEGHVLPLYYTRIKT